MSTTNRLKSSEDYSRAIYEIMVDIQPGIADMDLNEFRYALENLLPNDGRGQTKLMSHEKIERLLSNRDFYENIQLKPRDGDKIILDERIENLSRVLFIGLVEGKYSPAWVKARFYFDIRSFIFFPHTFYFTKEVIAHFGGKPYKRFLKRHQIFDRFQGIGYKDFMQANLEIDLAFFECIKKLVEIRGTPILISLAGPTAAGKTEITERLLIEFQKLGYRITTIEVDNFLLDRETRENKVMGKESIHYKKFKNCIHELLQGKKVVIPRYDFLNATSSHDQDGNLRPGCTPLEVEPADIVFIEGNFPFHTKEITKLIGIKIVYLTDDPIRLKRKWKRDIDYRKKYDPGYFRNRFFRTQFLRAEDIYRPLMEVCEMVVDTTNASLWVIPELVSLFDR